MEYPTKQIAENAGFSGDVVANECGKNKGFNAYKGEYEEDMIKAGIIDPVKVSRLALENAASIATMYLTIDAVVVDIPEKEDKMSQPPMGGMDGMM